MKPCEQLDDFLVHDLEGDALTQFVEHLPLCPDCRYAVAAEVRLERSLTAAVEQETLPRGTIVALERSINRRRQLRLAGACAALAASLAAIWLVTRPRPLPVELDRPRIVDAPAVAAVRVKFPAGNVIAVPEPIDAPNVTFLWVHPTLPLNSERSLP